MDVKHAISVLREMLGAEILHEESMASGYGRALQIAIEALEHVMIEGKPHLTKADHDQLRHPPV